MRKSSSVFEGNEGLAALDHGPGHGDTSPCEIDAWNRAHGYGPARIDPGFDPAMKAAFEGRGMADMLH